MAPIVPSDASRTGADLRRCPDTPWRRELPRARARDDAGVRATTTGSEFFIVYDDHTIASDGVGGNTVFGTVPQGLDIVRSIADAGTLTGDTDGSLALSVIITKVTAS